MVAYVMLNGLFNVSVKTETMPVDRMNAIIVPLFRKKGNKHEF